MPRITLLTLAALVAPFALSGQQLTAPPAPATTSPHDSVHGAIHAVDVGARTLDVKTGVGFALRIVRLQVPVDVPITDRADGGGAQPARIGLNALKPGDVIRATFGSRPTGLVAYVIQRVGRMDTGVGSTP